jgi:exonuclease SbcD
MRLLHTSDWHLGRSFHGVDMLSAQERALDGLVGVVRAEQVAAVIVAGDLYDRALPPVDAVELWGDTLDRLCDAGAQVIVISGNHDSARRLGGGGARQLARAGVHIRTDVARVAEPVLLEDDHDEVAIYAVPYLEPDVVRSLLAPPVAARSRRPAASVASATPTLFDDAQDAVLPPAAVSSAVSGLRTHAQVMAAAVSRCRDDLATRTSRGVVVAHAFVSGGQECDSERELTVGGAARVPLGAFDGFDYVALGHLHGRQTLGNGAVRYAGSPLAYSFSEERHVKGAWLVEITSTGLGPVEPVDTPVPRRLARLRGTMDELLGSSAYDEVEDCFLSVTLLDTACPVGAMARLQQRFPHCVELSWQPTGGLVASEGSYADRVAQPDDLAVLTEFVRHVRNTDVTDAERIELVAALEAGRLAALET